MNKSTIEAGQPEQVTNSEQKADIIPSAQVSANAVLSAALSVDEILSGNRLIAEFMCWDRTEPTNSTLFEQSIKHTQYHRSWDWLMPVVEKIEGDEVDLNISVVIKKNKCGIYRHKNSPYEIQLFLQESKSKKEAVWLAVVEFIKFYNQQ